MKDPMTPFNLGGSPAKLKFTISDYQIISPGDYVLCAVTGEKILLDHLRYWSADLQEPYVNGEVSARRWQDSQAARGETKGRDEA